MLKTTQLYSFHSAHAKLTEFAGYEMPLWYSSTSAEHLAVRNSSGLFDVSHMGRFQLDGPAATDLLEALLPTAVRSQPLGKAFYTLLLNDRGGIIDDLIVDKLEDHKYMVVVNASNAQTDMRHIMAHSTSDLGIEDKTATTTMIAVQGPNASQCLQPLTDLNLAQLKRFRCAETKVAGEEAIISRTGYTGEDGFEVIVQGPTAKGPDGAMKVWLSLASASTPCGLGARDSLRLEAGFPLHGFDIDQDTNPFEADLAWVVSPEKGGYIGSGAVSEERASSPNRIRRGVVLESGIPRHGFEVADSSGHLGKITSGSFSPIIHKGVALCMVERGRSELGSKVSVAIRDTSHDGTITKPPFYDERVYGWKRQKGN